MIRVLLRFFHCPSRSESEAHKLASGRLTRPDCEHLVSPLTRLMLQGNAYPGLTPRAKFIPPLRGWFHLSSRHYASLTGYEFRNTAPLSAQSSRQSGCSTRLDGSLSKKTPPPPPPPPPVDFVAAILMSGSWPLRNRLNQRKTGNWRSCVSACGPSVINRPSWLVLP